VAGSVRKTAQANTGKPHGLILADTGIVLKLPEDGKPPAVAVPDAFFTRFFQNDIMEYT